MASRIAEKKLEEGDIAMKEAEKLTTKTMFRWKPDWEAASGLYEKAGTCYKNAKAYEKAKQAFVKASTAFVSMKISFSAAKNLDLAATMAKEEKEMDESADLYEKAALLYREDPGHTEKSAETLMKAAKVIEDTNVERALQLCLDACSLFETDDRELYASQTFKTTMALSLKLKKYDQGLDLLNRQLAIQTKLNQPHDLNKTYLSIVILHLHRDDFVAADKAFKEFLAAGGFGSSPEGRAASEVLDAFENRNNEDLKKAVSQQTFHFLEQQIIKLAKDLRITDEFEGSASTSKKPSATSTTSTTSKNKSPPASRKPNEFVGSSEFIGKSETKETNPSTNNNNTSKFTANSESNIPVEENNKTLGNSEPEEEKNDKVEDEEDGGLA